MRNHRPRVGKTIMLDDGRTYCALLDNDDEMVAIIEVITQQTPVPRSPGEHIIDKTVLVWEQGQPLTPLAEKIIRALRWGRRVRPRLR